MTVYFQKPGEEFNPQVIENQEQLVQELFQAVKKHKSFQEEKMDVQKSFSDLKQLFFYANMQAANKQFISYSEKDRLLARYKASDIPNAIVNLVNEIKERY